MFVQGSDPEIDAERPFSLIDPLFNKKIFAAFVLFLFAFYSFLFWRMSDSPRTEPRPNKAPINDAEYRKGYLEGCRAFLVQMDADMTAGSSDSPRTEMSYSSSHEGYSERAVKGYIDGYHRAAESQHCPRGSHEN